MKRSTGVVTTGSGTEPSSSTASWKGPSRAAPTRVHALHPKLRRSPMMHHKRLMIHHIYELDGLVWHALRLTQPPLHRFAEPYIVSRLRCIRICYLSFNSLRSRGGHGFPALSAARLASRIATICFACERVSSRRLASPPRLPMAGRNCRTLSAFARLEMHEARQQHTERQF